MLEGRGNYVPYVPIKTGESWLVTAARLANRLLTMKDDPKDDKVPFSEPVLVDQLRLQLPIYFDCITRVAFLVELTPSACKLKYCERGANIAWYSLEDLTSGESQKKLLGPEPTMRSQFEDGPRVREKTVFDALLYPTDGDQSVELQLLRSSGVTEDHILRVYGDFLQHTFPSEFMTKHSFKKYVKMAKLEMPKGMDALFRAFATDGKWYISFREFILGLVVVGSLNRNIASEASSTGSNSATSDGDPPEIAKIKANFIFRYMAAKPDRLSQEELERLKIPKDELNKLKKSLKDGSMTRTCFTERIGQLLAPSRGSAQKSALSIFTEMESPPLSQLQSKQAYNALNRQQRAAYEAIKAKLKARLLCDNCRQKKYTVSCYMVKLSIDGIFYDPALTKEAHADVSRMDRVKRAASKDYFDASHMSNQVADMMRMFANKSKILPCKIKNNVDDWTKEETRIGNVDRVLQICEQARQLFLKGPRVVKVTSPCYVIGDIHGNLKDLLTYERNIWRTGIYPSTANVLFLGDYVDRGDYAVECVLYLFAMKLAAPDKIHLLRGNHEVRALQVEFTFKKEVFEKFKQEGGRVFDAFNQAFDAMPLVAIIDESIYCAHGGIPASAYKIEQIASLPCPLEDPDDNEVANQILWNDPCREHEYEDLLKNAKEVVSNPANKNIQSGFLFNTKRGTAFYYSDSGLEKFLKDNGLSHVIRAHECIPAGYQFHAGGRCITIFSCSHYCGGINEAAVALVNDSKIRVIKVDIPKDP